ncbi:MAG: protein kinase [Planctomycetes bacterium]|nr:protein kinase [Planctomycetota bacterium]
MDNEARREDRTSPVSESREISDETRGLGQPGKLGPPASQLSPADMAESRKREVLLKPGDRVGGCVVTRFIAWGGMGEVHEGRHETLDRRVAIKLVRGKYAEDDKYHARFLREAKASAKLTDPHIALVFDAGEREGKLFVILEYIEGEDVSRKLERLNTLPVDEALRITRDVALGLAHAHETGIVHRDVKPSNIMVNVQGMAKLMDFGLARKTGAFDPGHPDEGVVTGTPQYMSPEQWQDGELDARADLYSLGVTLYEMLCGKWPVDTNSVSEISAKVAARQLVPLRERAPGLDLELYNLVEWMLAPFDVRCASAKELASRLDKLIAKRQASNRSNSARVSKSIALRLPSTASEETASGAKEPFWLWGLGGAAIITVCLVLGIWRPWATHDGAEAETGGKGVPALTHGGRLAPLELRWTATAYRKTGSSGEVLDLLKSPALRAGDVWQLRLVPAQECYLYVVEIDAQGSVTQYFPASSELRAARVQAGKELHVPADAPWNAADPAHGLETLYVVASYEPMGNVGQLLKSLKQQASHGAKPDPADLRLLTKALEEIALAAPPDGAVLESAPAADAGLAPFKIRLPSGEELDRAPERAVGKAGLVRKLVIETK